MGKPLKVVVVGDSQNTALRVAADLEQCGYDPSFSLVSTEADLGRAAREGCDLVVAWRTTPSLPAEKALEVLRAGGPPRPLIVYADSYIEEEIVELVRAGAADCLRKGDLTRLGAAVERELRAPQRPGRRPRCATRPTRGTATAR